MYTNTQKPGKKERFFITVGFHLINVDRMMELQKSPFGNHHSNNCFRQELPSKQECKVQDSLLVSKYLPTRNLIHTKGNIVS